MSKKQFNFRAWPRSHFLADFGYFSAPVQKAIKKHKDQIGVQWCENYLPSCYNAVLGHWCDEIKIPVACEAHRDYIFDLIEALRKLGDKRKPHIWVLQMGYGGDTPMSECPPGNPFPLLTFKRIQQDIVRIGGPKFSEDALKKAFERLNPIVTKPPS